MAIFDKTFGIDSANLPALQADSPNFNELPLFTLSAKDQN